MIKLHEVLKIADIHASRLKTAVKEMEIDFPFTIKKLQNLSVFDLGIFELYTSRFSKLQDHIGNNVFPLLLKAMGEYNETMSFIDRINKLEKLGIVESAAEWRNLREIRNHLSHEYPDKPEIMVTNLNEAYAKRFVLLDCLDRSHRAATKLKNLR